MSEVDDKPMDFDTYRMIAMYTDGVSVADIALSFGWASKSQVYRRLNEFPAKYEEAKKHLLQKRNAKYRRVGALSLDIQLNALEHYQEKLAFESTPEKEKQEIRDKLKDISSIGESAERRADLNEGKVTDHIKVDREPTPDEWKLFWKRNEEAGNGLDTESIQA